MGFLWFWLEFIASFFCNNEKTYNADVVYAPNSKYVGINGKALKIGGNMEPQVAAVIQQYPHQDLSPIFPTFLFLKHGLYASYADPRLQQCIGDHNRTTQADNWLNYRISQDSGYELQNGELKSCPLPNQPNITGAPCFSPFPGDNSDLSGEDVKAVYNSLPTQEHPNRTGYVVLDGDVLDVTSYLVASTNLIELPSNWSSRTFVADRMFLPLDLSILLYVKLGKDITDDVHKKYSTMYNDCLKLLFFKGIVESKRPQGCAGKNPALWATMGVGFLYFLIKMNLANLARVPFIQRLLFSPERPFITSRPTPYTIMMIPCYNEPRGTLKQTFESLARTCYDDSKKLLLFVCDGVTKNAHDAKETHLFLLESLGYSCTEEPTPRPYVSLGQKRRKPNYVKVYSGYYETGRNRVPYLVVVKVGNSKEISSERVPGNRGKRDSMVMIFGFLERCMNLANNLMTPLEYELFNQCYSVLGIDPRCFKYLLVTDADTQVHGDTVGKLVSRLENDRKMLAISGHIRPANPEQNITTMLQIFPLYLTYFTGLAYEACLSRVMSMNGGLAMYRIWLENADFGEEKWHMPEQHTFRNSKWPKTSDEILPPKDSWDDDTSFSTDTQSQLSLSRNTGILPCCIHPTVLREFALPQADTMHMQNVLLLGEEQYLSTVLLKSHPGHHLGFEPKAIGYVTLPTNFFALQGLQVRNIRSAFHNQLRMQRISWQLGFSYWILSSTELLDMIFSTPIIVYLYRVYIRAFNHGELSYYIIAGCFASLVVLHAFSFVMRRQFKYVLWFALYCLVSVPLYMIWFPLKALWCMDYAERWYDVWPRLGGKRVRLHGIVDDTKDNSEDSFESEPKNGTNEDKVPRMRLGEYDAEEARKSYRRAQLALDTNFIGFTALGNGKESIASRRTISKLNNSGQEALTLPQAREQDGLHNAHTTTIGKYQPPATTVDIHGRVTGSGKPRSVNNRLIFDNTDLLPPSSFNDDSPQTAPNPFADPLTTATDNPFDDGHAVDNDRHLYCGNERKNTVRHKPSYSQSSYYTNVTRTTKDDQPIYCGKDSNIVGNESTIPSSVASSGFAKMYDTEPPADVRLQNTDQPHDRQSVFSMASATHSFASSNLSMDPEATLEKTRRSTLHEPSIQDNDEGRSSALHGKFNLRIPRHSNASASSTRGLAIPTRSRHQPPTLPLLSSLAGSVSDNYVSEADCRAVLRNEIRAYLEEVNLNSTTRAQVKAHLFNVFGDKIEQDHETQMFIHDCIEEVTLEYLTR
ncbi:hypothetical protein DFQ30_002470 [Apophysomyces sp. BC1015]|nr:hypothetical protein DFQ30_002470 [Apophysomyces sp. BC1015]